jgi:hypothetical protein
MLLAGCGNRGEADKEFRFSRPKSADKHASNRRLNAWIFKHQTGKDWARQSVCTIAL